MEREFLISRELLKLVGVKAVWLHAEFLQRNISDFTYFTKKELKEITGMSPKTQDKYLKKLVDVGAIDITKDPNGIIFYKLTNKFNPYGI
jgi:Fic family protein